MEQLREYTDRTGNFHNNIIFDDDLPVGFITYWDFDSFYYVEHFATNPALRNGGYGKRTLEYLCNYLKRPIVLEVERPIEEMAKRRISFINVKALRCGEKDYSQPPYKPGDDFLPMYLMVHGELDCEKDFETIKKRIHKRSIWSKRQLIKLGSKFEISFTNGKPYPSYDKRKGVQFELNALFIYIELTNYFSPRLVAE